LRDHRIQCIIAVSEVMRDAEEDAAGTEGV
jgi:hypothetical protein